MMFESWQPEARESIRRCERKISITHLEKVLRVRKSTDDYDFQSGEMFHFYLKRKFLMLVVCLRWAQLFNYYQKHLVHIFL